MTSLAVLVALVATGLWPLWLAARDAAKAAPPENDDDGDLQFDPEVTLPPELDD